MQMQFKNPEFLYFLALLLVPILVHLLQLRRFKPIEFTHVAALKQLQTQSRKSAKLKRYLLLATRLLLLAAAILAFAGPYIPSNASTQQPTTWVIVLDNTFSMQAKGAKGTLLEEAKQAILNSIPANSTFDFYTADQSWERVTRDQIQQEISQITYSPLQVPYESIIAKYEKAHEKAEIIVLTDGAQADSYPENKWVNWSQWQLSKQNSSNTWIESAQISAGSSDKQSLQVTLKSSESNEEMIALAVYKDQEVVAKTMTGLQNGEQLIQLELDVKNSPIELRIEDNGLLYDNHWYLATQSQAINPVVVIGEQAYQNVFTRLLQHETSFPISHQRPDQLDFRALEQASLIVFNQIQAPSTSLIQHATAWREQGKNLVFIPASEMDISAWNSWFSQWNGPVFQNNAAKTKVRLNQIIQNHPLLKEAFTSKVNSFQYPQMAKLYQVKNAGEVAMKLDDDTPFLGQYTNGLGKISLFTQPIQHEQSNFKQSPLAVVSLYNLVLQAQILGQNQIEIGSGQTYLAKASSAQTNLRVKGEKEEFIPVQRWVNNQMELQFDQAPTWAGLYQVMENQSTIGHIGFNYSREESNQSPAALATHVQQVDQLADYWNSYEQHNSETPFWKALLWIAFIALLLEILIQKLLK